jgi:formylglycine-generating enzyme required for sulfatase activity
MRAATLKTLIINSAEDLGNPGPDYTYGWGLVNVLEAGRAVKKYAQNPAGRALLEDKLIDGQTLEIPCEYEGAGPIRISLGWTDPPGAAQTTNTVTVPALINNLHLQLIGPDGSVHLPYVMPYVTGTAEKAPFDVSLLGENAVSGTNYTDNTIQIYIPEPLPGGYRAEISRTGSLTGGEQSFSLAVQGLTYAGPADPPVIELHPLLGDGTDFFAFEVTGNGFLLGADLIFRRDGFEPVYAYAVEVSGTRLFARVDTFTMAGGAWDIVVRNPDGQETVSPQQFFNQRDLLELVGVSVAQRPGTKLVDISYDVWSDATNVVTVSLTVDGEIAAASLSGDTGAGISIGSGKSIVWDACADWDGNEGPLNLTLIVDDGFSTSSMLTNINVDTRDYVLTVQSEYGNPAPGTGTHFYAWGTIVTCKVDAVVSSGSSNFICTGWTGGGSVPVSGTANSTGALLLSNLNSSVFWEWTRLQTEVEWAQIGDPGNPDDVMGRGSVGYIYSIGKHEVSIAQFINARKADSLISDGDENYWGNSVNSNAPAAYMSWHEAARFCNWLTSGNASNGAYQLGESNLVTAVDRTAALDQYGTVYAMPTLNEWHKAAYWTGSDYSDYANGSDNPPFASTEANYNPLGTPWPVGSGTVEQSGTFDMMGNVWEWTETPSSSPSNRVIRGGHYSGTTNNLRNSVTFSGIPTSSSVSYGLRIAAIETPSPGVITHGETVIDMEFVMVATAGNPADTTGKGAVNYLYQIGKCEVTIGQFKEAYAADNRISNGGEDYWNKGSYSLGTNAPATTVTWHEAARFCNWLTSGNALDGAYQLDVSGIVTNVDRASAALAYATVYVIPTEDEWYKAAYWTGSGYSTYANGAGFAPVAHLDSNYSPTDKPWEVVTGAQEQNGTFNMMGNVAEWSESVASNQGQYLLGGWYSDNAARFRAGSGISTTNKLIESYYYGLRVVQLKRDSDDDGLPDSWEIQHFGSIDKADPDAVCSNGVNKIRDAYIAGLDPTDSQSAFMTSILSGRILQWSAISGRVYNVHWTTNLLTTGFQCLESNIPWTQGEFTNLPAAPCGYYKIDVRLDP